MRKWLLRKYAGYTTSGKIWLTVGVTCLTVDMAIGFLAGYSVATFWHGMGYAALALGFAFLPDAAYEEYEARRWISACVMGIVCLPIGIKAYEQQLTYSAGMRSGEMQSVGVVNARYDGAQDDVKRYRDEYATLQVVMASLQKEWPASVTAEGLREQVKTLDAAIAAEGSPKNGGCKRKCLDLMNEKKAVESKIAAAEKISETQKRINFLQGKLDQVRSAADKAEHKTSLNVDVAKVTARLFKIAKGASAEEAIKDDDVSQQYATLGSAGLGSLALLLLAPIGMFLAGRRRVDDMVVEDGKRPPRPIVRMTPAPPLDVSMSRLRDIRDRLATV